MSEKEILIVLFAFLFGAGTLFGLSAEFGMDSADPTWAIAFGAGAAGCAIGVTSQPPKGGFADFSWSVPACFAFFLSGWMALICALPAVSLGWATGRLVRGAF